MRTYRELLAALVAVVAIVTCSPDRQVQPAVAITDPAPNSLVPRVVKVHALIVASVVKRVSLIVDSSEYQTYAEDLNDVTFIWNAGSESAWSRRRSSVDSGRRRTTSVGS